MMVVKPLRLHQDHHHGDRSDTSPPGDREPTFVRTNLKGHRAQLLTIYF